MSRLGWSISSVVCLLVFALLCYIGDYVASTSISKELHQKEMASLKKDYEILKSKYENLSSLKPLVELKSALIMHYHKNGRTELEMISFHSIRSDGNGKWAFKDPQGNIVYR